MPPEEAVPSVRDALSAAYDQVAAKEESAAQPASPSPGSPTSPDAAGVSTPLPEGAKAEAPAAGAEKPYLSGEAPPPVAGAAAPKPGEKPAEAKPGEKPPEGGLRPPESWKPAIREKHWATLNPVVQAEILRREHNISEVLRASTEARRVATELGQVVGHFKDVFEYEKKPPMETIATLLNVTRVLRTAAPAQRAQQMAQVIQGFGVDLKLLDQALAYSVQNAPEQSAEQRTAMMFQQQLAAALAPMQQALAGLTQQQRAAVQQQNSAMETEVSQFAEKNEYFDLVRDDVADILEFGARRGQKITLAQAYDRAILSRNDLAPLVTQQRLQQSATTVSAPALAAKKLANMSVSGAPSTAVAPGLDPSKSVRNALEAAWEEHSQRAS